MLPSMPILFSLSSDSVLEGKHTQASNSPQKEPNPDLPKKVPSISDEIPDYKFDSLPEDERECDELVLLAENTPFNEKRKLLAQANASRKKRKIETVQPADRNSDEEQINHFATAYFMKAKGELDEETFQKFITLLSELNEENVDVPSFYCDITTLLSGYPDLVHEFLVFLKPHQALEVGKFDEYLSLKRSWNFLRKLDPFHLNKINHLLEQLSTNSDVTIESLKTSLHSLFKGHPNITDGILGLLPDEKPPPSCKEDYEDISDLSTENSSWETLTIPESKGRCIPGECECICHSFVPKKFCTFCNIKFSKGQIYVQTGKGLRFAKVTFKGENQEEMLQKLHPTYYIKLTPRKRTKSDSRSRNRAEADHNTKSDNSSHDNVNESDKNTIILEKVQNENQHMDEDDKALENHFNSDNEFIVYEDINNDEFVSEDVVLESTNSEEAEDLEYDSLEEFNMEASPNSLKHDEDSFNSSEQIFEEKDSSGAIMSENKAVSTLPTNEKEDLNEKPETNVKKEDTCAFHQKDEIPRDDQPKKTETKEETKLWTREEDKLILQAFQRQLGMEQTFSDISKQLPSRTVDDIQGRFQVLMSLLEKMTSGSYEGYPS